MGNVKMTVFGNWKLIKNENFDEYMEKLGVSWALRKAGAMANSTTKIEDVNGDVRIASTSTVKSSNNIFKIGAEVDEKTMDGRQVKTTYKWDGKETTLKWEATGIKLTCTLEMDGIVCKRYH